MRSDPILAAIVGEDQDHEVKVYTPLAKSNAEAPYVTFALPGISDVIPVYGDTEALESFEIAVTSWARTGNEVWQVADAADDALKSADYSWEPSYTLYMRRISTPVELRDRDTNLHYLVVRYEFAIGR
jgi:hypothetical protein